MVSLTLAVALAVLQQAGPPGQPPPRFSAGPLPYAASLVAPGTVSPQDSNGPVPARPASGVAARVVADTPVQAQPAPAAPDSSSAAPRAAVGADVPAGGNPPPAPAAGSSARRPAAIDTPVVRRPQAVEYSDWYGRRLAVHRVASYALLPLLGLQYYTGTQLMAQGSDAPDWVIRLHGPLATTSAVVFGANTVTGLWNLWDARKDPNGRFSRTAHGLLMLASDAGFLAAGSMGHQAVQDGSTRSLHRTIAISSMGVALVAYAIMLPPFRK